MKTRTNLNPKILRFAVDMQDRLDKNRHKGEWSNCDIRWLLMKLIEEVGELSVEINTMYTPDGKPRGDSIGTQSYAEMKAQMECADVANLAMMISDVLKG